VKTPSSLDSLQNFGTKEEKTKFKSLLNKKLSKRRFIKLFKELKIKTTQR
jgi:hypothetical protein